MRQYDFATIVEFPSNETTMTFLFGLGRLGNVRIETLITVPVDQEADLIDSLP